MTTYAGPWMDAWRYIIEPITLVLVWTGVAWSANRRFESVRRELRDARDELKAEIRSITRQ